MYLRLFLLLVVSLLCFGAASFNIVVDKVVENIIYFHTNSKETLRIYVCQHDKAYIKYRSSGSNFKYVYTLIPGMEGKVVFSHTALETAPYIAIYARSITSKASSILNYEVDTLYQECNKNELQILDVKDNKDSCITITAKYEGKGDIYVYAGIQGINTPTSQEVVQSGIYIGTHDHSDVTTIYCGIIPNNNYVVYATVKDGDCIHRLAEFSLPVKDLLPGIKYSPFIVSQYVSNLPSSQTRNGVRYRRYNPHVSVPAFFDNVNITKNGLLIDPLSEVRRTMNERQGVPVSDEIAPQPAIFSIEWFFSKFEDSTFLGRFFVLGKGDVYIFNSNKAFVSVLDVYTYGKNIGFFEEESVEVSITGVNPESTVYAILGYGEQFYGPFSVSS